MKYFTPDLYGRMQLRTREEMNAADVAWEQAVDRYEEQLQRLRSQLSEHVRQYLADLYLHDATLWHVLRQGNRLHLTLRSDSPSREFVLLTYTLTCDPVVEKGVLPPELQSHPVQYLYNEFDLVHEDGRILYTESILFSNGWELRLKYSDVQVALAQAIYPVPESAAAPGPLAQSA